VFVPQFQNSFPFLFNMEGYRIERVAEEDDNGAVVVIVAVRTATASEHKLEFTMERKQPPALRKGCWMTTSIRRIDL
jgi:hypothetical protein